ncbi:hypothetical protein Bsel_3291 [[Bacillus] selenitireducens MLS10]|uniref:Uncharacterized protein n=2 Tax=Salisediminibacterium selenitireducens TaxID=85683 RepID=D6Y1I6_BACIE|nr:hypothetical protein Bsel_3291 [[Bacillus] selenitireducens MLS10]
MRIIYGLIADGQVNPDGTFKNPLHMAVALDMQDTRILGMEGLEPLAKEAYDKKIDQDLIDTYITKNR